VSQEGNRLGLAVFLFQALFESLGLGIVSKEQVSRFGKSPFEVDIAGLLA
jgi:hypothetical protein